MKLRKAGVFSRVDDSNTSIGKRYARNDELGTPYGVTLDFACTSCGSLACVEAEQQLTNSRDSDPKRDDDAAVSFI